MTAGSLTPKPYQVLEEAPEGAVCLVQACTGGDGLARRLNEVGLVQGVEVEVLENTPPGPLLVGVFGTRIVLERADAAQITVGRAQA